MRLLNAPLNILLQSRYPGPRHLSWGYFFKVLDPGHKLGFMVDPPREVDRRRPRQLT